MARVYELAEALLAWHRSALLQGSSIPSPLPSAGLQQLGHCAAPSLGPGPEAGVLVVLSPGLRLCPAHHTAKDKLCKCSPATELHLHSSPWL